MDANDSVFQFNFCQNSSIKAKSSFRIGRLVNAARKKTHRITFKFSVETITVLRGQLIENSIVEETTHSLVTYLRKDMNPVDTERLHAALETLIGGSAAPIVMERMLTRITSSPAWHNDFLVEIPLVYMFAPSRVHGLSALVYFHNYVHHDVTTPDILPTHELAIKNTLDCKVTMSSSDDCAICLDEFPSDCEAVSMPCSHAFHGPCIEKWLRTSHYCPLCRFEMPTTQQPTQSNPFQVTRS